ncbi:MAG: C-GCAxxG-C-C family protein [Draconibacterium sp.]|nr:C-GCAxxG-C-C family protein [Draconibacterium sp.]
MTKKAQFVDERFSQVNCAQTVLSLYAEDIGLDEKTALKIASGFGGGMACAETCGAVTGAYMVIGMKHGHASSDPDAKANTKQKIQLFNEKFKATHDTLICKELTGYDISTPEGAFDASEEGVFSTLCPKFIKTACTILEEDF